MSVPPKAWRQSAARWLVLLPLGVAVIGAGCAGSYRLERRAATVTGGGAPEDVLRPRWRKQLVRQSFLAFKPQEWASAAVGPDGAVYVGSSAKRFWALDGADGSVRWKLKTQGAVASAPLLDTRSQTVFFGANDGVMYAVNSKTGEVRWRYETQGTINRKPALGGGLLFFTTSEGRIYAVTASNGKWRWQYDREMPEGFTIFGYSGVAVGAGVVYTGFADGMLVALKLATGDVVWTRSLAQKKTQFVDVDTTPVLAEGMLFTASYAGGVFAVDPENGSILWTEGTEGVTRLLVHQRRVFFAAPQVGVVSLDLSGRKLWQQAVPRGVPGAPVVSQSYLFLTGSETGLSAATADTGRLLQHFDPGHGISAPVTVGDNGLLVVLTNFGWLHAFDLVPPQAS